MKRFKPSKKSEAPEDRVTHALRYIAHSAEQLAKASETEELPGWVVSRIGQAASIMGVAASFVSRPQKDEQ